MSASTATWIPGLEDLDWTSTLPALALEVSQGCQILAV